MPPPLPWTLEQILRFAPDNVSRKNASELANPRKWQRLFMDDPANPAVLWGECRGSSAEPYRSTIELSGPGFTCTCPSRKRPCKHALGLLLLFAGQPGTFEASAPPDWVTAWLAKRSAQNERKAAREAGGAPEPDEESRSRRAEARDQKIRAGLDDLETWLCDLLRQGLAAAQAQPQAFWERAAARLVDAQAPGLARLVRNMANKIVSGEGWQERVMDQVARLVLAIDGYRRIDSLPVETQANLRAVIGFVTRKEDLLKNTGVHDTWLALGRVEEEEAGLKVQRTWLFGQRSARPALLLSFIPLSFTTSFNAENGADKDPLPGGWIESELVYFPGAHPLRAVPRTVLQTGHYSLSDLAGLPVCESLVEATAGYAAALAANPWLERCPLLAGSVVPYHMDGRWVLCDRQGRWIPLARSFSAGWTLLAISGGRPVTVFGEWNGESLRPLSTWNAESLAFFTPSSEGT